MLQILNTSMNPHIAMTDSTQIQIKQPKIQNTSKMWIQYNNDLFVAIIYNITKILNKHDYEIKHKNRPKGNV